MKLHKVDSPGQGRPTLVPDDENQRGQLSFDQYYATWRLKATALTENEASNLLYVDQVPFATENDEFEGFSRRRTPRSRSTVKEQRARRYVYGVIMQDDKKKTGKMTYQDKIDRIDQMKRAWGSQNGQKSSNYVSSAGVDPHDDPLQPSVPGTLVADLSPLAKVWRFEDLSTHESGGTWMPGLNPSLMNKPETASARMFQFHRENEIEPRHTRSRSGKGRSGTSKSPSFYSDMGSPSSFRGDPMVYSESTAEPCLPLSVAKTLSRVQSPQHQRSSYPIYDRDHSIAVAMSPLTQGRDGQSTTPGALTQTLEDQAHDTEPDLPVEIHEDEVDALLDWSRQLCFQDYCKGVLKITTEA